LVWRSISATASVIRHRPNGRSSTGTDAMPYRSLRDFIAKLESAGELVRVREPVSTVLEMTEIQTRLIAREGPAVIFEKPVKADGTPSDIPVLVNLFGTVKRVAMGVTMGGVERTTAASFRE